MLQRIVDRYCQLLSVVMVACLALMVVLVFGNVVLRYAANSGIAVSEELSRWLFVWNGLVKYRRMLGLFTFFYACVHLSMWSFVDWLMRAQGAVARGRRSGRGHGWFPSVRPPSPGDTVLARAGGTIFRDIL